MGARSRDTERKETERCQKQALNRNKRDDATLCSILGRHLQRRGHDRGALVVVRLVNVGTSVEQR